MNMVFRVREIPEESARVPGARARFFSERGTGGFVASRIDPAGP